MLPLIFISKGKAVNWGQGGGLLSQQEKISCKFIYFKINHITGFFKNDKNNLVVEKLGGSVPVIVKNELDN